MASQRQCEKVLDANEERLGSLPNVVGLGIVSANDTEPGSSECAVAVYVTKKVPKEELRREDLIPKELEVRNLRGSHTVPVRIIEQGDVELEVPDLAEPGKEPL